MWRDTDHTMNHGQPTPWGSAALGQGLTVLAPQPDVGLWWEQRSGATLVNLLGCRAGDMHNSSVTWVWGAVTVVLSTAGDPGWVKLQLCPEQSGSVVSVGCCESDSEQWPGEASVVPSMVDGQHGVAVTVTVVAVPAR